MDTRTVYPRHDVANYAVEEHDIVTCPPDLWPFIKEWAERRDAAANA
jgi:hypothetical protein